MCVRVFLDIKMPKSTKKNFHATKDIKIQEMLLMKKPNVNHEFQKIG
jgi:hypothetical protein